MLYSAMHIERNTASLFWHVGLSPAGSLVVVHRRGLVYDGRYAPVSRAGPRARRVIYLVLRGCFHPSNERRPTEAPTAWLVSEDDLEGAHGRRRYTMRTWGEPLVSVTLHVRARDCAQQLFAGDAPRRLAMPVAVLDAAERYATLVRAKPTDAVLDAAARALLDEVAAAGWLREGARPWLDAPVAAYATRIWRAISEFYSRTQMSPTMAQLSGLARWSSRTVDRALRRWVDEYGLPTENWRAFSRRWRLKTAVLLLSSREFRVADVAALVGYSNAEALTNALAAEGLPSPLRYRTLFRDLGAP